jgi:hypothetical protein
MMHRIMDEQKPTSIVFLDNVFYCDHKKLDGLCGKCAVWLLENGYKK